MSFWSSESSTKLALGMPSRDKSHGTKLHKNEPPESLASLKGKVWKGSTIDKISCQTTKS